MNSKLPLYKVDTSESMQKYAIDLKEMARSIINTSNSLGYNPDGTTNFSNKKAVSSDDAIVSAELISDVNSSTDDESFNIHVTRLATAQTNTGNYLSSNKIALKNGEYSFDIGVGDYAYEFQFSVNKDDTNKTLQEKLSRLINRSNIGLSSKVLEDSSGNSSLEIKSNTIGLSDFRPEIFSLSNSQPLYETNVIDYLGINNISTEPHNALFTLNGEEKTSSSNQFTIGKKYEISLNSVSPEGENTTIDLSQNLDSVIDNINNLVTGYNDIIDLVSTKLSEVKDSDYLMRRITNSANNFKNELDSAGITVKDDGHIEVDESLMVQSSKDGTLLDSLKHLDYFKNDLLKTANNISLNPMNYVNKKLLTYPNPARPMNSPYNTSRYAGMMFDGYL